jgi:hypothetical protein
MLRGPADVTAAEQPEPGPGRQAWEQAIIRLLGRNQPWTYTADEILRRATNMLRPRIYIDSGVEVPDEDERFRLGAQFIERTLVALRLDRDRR